MKFKVLAAFSVVAVVALAMTQEDQYEVDTRAVYDHVVFDSGPVIATYWHPDADTFLVVYDRAGLEKGQHVFAYPVTPEANGYRYRSRRNLELDFTKFASPAFSWDGSRLAIWGSTYDPVIAVFDVETWEVAYRTHVDSLNTNATRINGAVLSPTGDTLWLPDSTGLMGIDIATGKEFVVNVMSDTMESIPYSISSDGRYINGVGTKRNPSGLRTIDGTKWFIHDLKTRDTEFYVEPGVVPGTRLFFPPEPGFCYELGWEGSTPVMRKRSLPDREILATWPLLDAVTGVTFSQSGEWVIVSGGHSTRGFTSYIYHRDPYYLAGVVADSLNVPSPNNQPALYASTAIFSPDDQWIAGFRERGDLTLFAVEKTLLSVEDGTAGTAGERLNLKLLPNILRRESDVYLGSTTDFIARITIVDVAGRVVSDEEKRVQRSGTILLSGESHSLSLGRYFVVVRDEQGRSMYLPLIVQ